MDYKKLIEDLRVCSAKPIDCIGCSRSNTHADTCCAELKRDALSAIEELRREDARKTALLLGITAKCGTLVNINGVMSKLQHRIEADNARLRVENDELQAELEAAKICIGNIEASLGTCTDKYIKRAICEWRGRKEKGNEND